jgi:ketosteroid isomerase-like protein
MKVTLMSTTTFDWMHAPLGEMAKLETLKRLFNECWMPGDLDRLDEVLDPSIVWTAIESAPDAGTRRGYDECRAYMKEWLDDFVLEPSEIHEIGSTPAGDVVCSLTGHATGRASGARTEICFAITCRFTVDGRIVSIHEHATLSEAWASDPRPKRSD